MLFNEMRSVNFFSGLTQLAYQQGASASRIRLLTGLTQSDAPYNG
jgi:hypothetical protein